MPAARQRSRSSFRERAVKAMTGKWPPAVRSRSRIARTTWKPSSSGMWTSRSSRSKAPSSARASASRPLFASRTRWPRRTSSCSRSCALNSLSSATRMCSGAAAGTGCRGGFPARRGPGRRRGVAVGPAHHPVDRLEQLVLLDRLEQVGVDPQLAEPGQVAGAVPGGQQDDARGGQLGPLPDLAARARPSVSGMRASSSTSAYGRPQAAPCQRASRPPARRPPPPAPSASRAATPPGCGGWWRCHRRSAPAGCGAGPAAGRRPAPAGAAGARTAP